MDTQKQMIEKRVQNYIGKTLRCIVEGYHQESPLLMCARHAGQCPDIDGEIIINDTSHVHAFGEWYDVTITDVAGYDLVGEV